MRSGLIVVAVCVLIGSVGGAIMMRNAQRQIGESRELVLGLIYYLESSGGKMPQSQEAFLSSPFVERLPAQDGRISLRIRPPATSRFRTDPRGTVIRDLRDFVIGWGAEPATLTVDQSGAARTPAGGTLKLFAWASKSKAANVYGEMLIDAAREITGITAKPGAGLMPPPKQARSEAGGAGDSASESAGATQTAPAERE
ncbi:MAG: hypothetical protein HRU75_08000 [Planctomycetia bacterium]|nr:MAG: hypothetical protein HRU75_08000 [Planctomycetia bacterium]